MKRYERELLNSLTNSQVSDEEPLKNIKEELGSLRYVEGNPLFKAEINLQITSVFFDQVGGVIIAPGALPAPLQTSLPVFLLGLTDSHSGFLKSRVICPVGFGWEYMTAPPVGFILTGIIGYNAIIWAFPAFAPFVQYGDLIIQYADNAAAPAFIGLIVVRCTNVGYGTFLNSFVSDLITVNLMRLIVPVANINQFENPLIFGYQTLFGKLKTDSIDPRMYQTPGDFQNQIADIPITFPVDKNLMLAFQLDVFCQQMTVQLFAQKVEPLTLRPK